MPTGIEEAGLVLAVFPIIVGLIDEYRQGLGMTIRDLSTGQDSVRANI